MENKYRVLFYETERGTCPVEEFLNSLPIKVRAKVAKWIEKLEEYGPDLPRPYADIVRGKIRELRVIFSSGQYRFLYFFYNEYIIMTHGFLKKTDKVVEGEIARAHHFMIDFEERIRKGDTEL